MAEFAETSVILLKRAVKGEVAGGAHQIKHVNRGLYACTLTGLTPAQVLRIDKLWRKLAVLSLKQSHKLRSHRQFLDTPQQFMDIRRGMKKRPKSGGKKGC